MSALGVICRYVSTMTRVFFGRFESDYVLKAAEIVGEDGQNEEVTAEMIAALATRDLSPLLGAPVVVSYTYKGTGPYSYYLSRSNPSFPPEAVPRGDMVPPERQIILAERGEDQDDVTDALLPFAGPDGTFHGMCRGCDGWEDFDPRMVFPGLGPDEEITLTFASGDSRTLVYSKEETI